MMYSLLIELPFLLFFCVMLWCAIHFCLLVRFSPVKTTACRRRVYIRKVPREMRRYVPALMYLLRISAMKDK